MSIRLEMLQVARIAPKLLGESTALVEAFLRRQQNPDGGFKDRTGRSDLYYTVFGLDGLLALQAELPLDSTTAYLKTFGDGDGLDFVHRCCLARAWATVTSFPARKDELRESHALREPDSPDVGAGTPSPPSEGGEGR
ncbi:MAG: hypothetical protein HZA89_15995, partial [Verrucomicrobia bacterium]|nr:hypothetical protein [Verrucomicrobiota bacterium]